MTEFINDTSQKMSELVMEHAVLINVLKRMGISLGFGDHSVEDICRRHNIDPGFFLLICNIYCNKQYVPTEHRVISTDMTALVPYLKGSHAFYTDNRLPHIERHLDHIAQQLPTRVADVFMNFFRQYRQEVEAHFAHEEQDVFPHIEALQNNSRDNGYCIGDFLESHTDTEDKLNDLLQIVFKYLPEGITGDDAVSVVFDILQLSHDLNRHSFVEEKVMVPYVLHLERKAR